MKHGPRLNAEAAVAVGGQVEAGAGMAAAGAATAAVVVGEVAGAAGVVIAAVEIVVTEAIAGKWASLKSWAFSSCNAATSSFLRQLLNICVLNFLLSFRH